MKLTSLKKIKKQADQNVIKTKSLRDIQEREERKNKCGNT